MKDQASVPKSSIGVAGGSSGSERIECIRGESRLPDDAENGSGCQDMPVIPIFFYASAQLWPPELEGMHLNASDSHPPKFLRWKKGRRPEGSRMADFPRLPSRAGDIPEEDRAR